MMENLFSPSINSKQFQVGQKGVKHMSFGACEITHVEIYQGKIFYEIRIIETGMKLKCISSKLISSYVDY